MCFLCKICAVVQDPFKTFQSNVNACGNHLSESQRKVVEEEVPLATGHSMQLCEALAHTA